MKWRLFSLITTSILLSACSSVQKPAELNYFFVDKWGDIVDPDTNEPFPSDEAEQRALRSIIETDRDTIMIYIHGGLNTPESAIARANEMRKVMDKNQEIHPIFINWRSGPFTSYGEHLFFHRKGEHWSVAGPLTFPFVLLEDFGRALIRAPRSLVNSFNTYRKTYEFPYSNSGTNAYVLEDYAFNSNYYGSLTPKEDLRGKSERLTAHGVDTLKHGVGIIGNLVMDFVGPGSWDVMKRRTELMFVKSRPEESDEYQSMAEYTEWRKGGLNNFLSTLIDYLGEAQNSGKNVILVGHSMGTIIANNMLTAKPQIKYDRIIYMGAACSIRDFQMSVVPYLVANPDTEFYNYMLDPKAENSEAPVWGLAGTGSLLVQIDDIYERPVAENQRTLGRWENVMNGLNYFDVDDHGQNYEALDGAAGKSLKHRIHLRTIPYVDTSPTRHGEFDDVDKMNNKNGYFWEPGYHLTPQR